MHPAAANPAAGRADGFTLIEALVVLGVVGLVAGLAYPQIDRAMATLQARQARVEVAGGLLQARAQAMRVNRPVALAVTADGTGFSVGTAPAHTLPGAARLDALPDRIWFYPDGSASGGAIGVVTATGRTDYVVSPRMGLVSEAVDRAAAGADAGDA